MLYAEVDDDIQRFHQFRGGFSGTLTDRFENFRQHHEIGRGDRSQQRIPTFEILIRSVVRYLARKVLSMGNACRNTWCRFLIGLGLAPYPWLVEVDRHRARQRVTIILVQSALSLVILVPNAAALIIFRGVDGFASFDVDNRAAIGMLLIRMHNQANGINETFWSLWLLPFGWLVVRSRFLPRVRRNGSTWSL